jgi:hypothetical protein
MDQMLASFFGTGGAAEPQPTAEDAEKTAQAKMFAKLAADQNIDLSKCSQGQIEFLWERTFGKEAGAAPTGEKVAEFPPPKGDEDEEKKKREAEARKEHEEKKASAERFDQATFFGKTAAHAYVAEMKNIIEAGGLDFMKEASIGDHLKKGLKKLDEAGAAGARRVARIGEGGKTVPVGHSKTRDAIAAHGHRAAAGAAAAGGAAAGIHHATKEKKSSAFEVEAAELALAKVAEAQFDQAQAVERLNAVLTLGLNDSEKVASLSTYEEAIERRALEYAAAAGYPVEWNDQ